MIDWSAIRLVAKEQIARFGEVVPSSVRWVDEPSGPLDGALPVIYLRIASIIGVGCEEERRFDDEENPENDLSILVCGQRQFTLSIRVESFTPDISDPRHAANIIEKIKIRMCRTSAIDERFESFAIRDFGATKWFSYLSNGRQVDAYLCDFLCLTVDNDVDDSLDAGGWIQKVQGTGRFNPDQPDEKIINIDVKDEPT